MNHDQTIVKYSIAYFDIASAGNDTIILTILEPDSITNFYVLKCTHFVAPLFKSQVAL